MLRLGKGEIMQDRYRFRFWNKKTNKWFYFGFETFPTYEKEIWKALTNGEKIYQCTGLKDKNGKLIYEGDILDLYVSSKKLYRYEVKYEIGSFMLVSQDEIFDFPNVWNDYVYPLSQLYYEYQNEENCIYECEIIGNVYENPELLENKQ